jgi:hypothetical protein
MQDESLLDVGRHDPRQFLLVETQQVEVINQLRLDHLTQRGVVQQPHGLGDAELSGVDLQLVWTSRTSHAA